jgi:hypothetical protein
MNNGQWDSSAAKEAVKSLKELGIVSKEMAESFDGSEAALDTLKAKLKEFSPEADVAE